MTTLNVNYMFIVTSLGEKKDLKACFRLCLLLYYLYMCFIFSGFLHCNLDSVVFDNQINELLVFSICLNIFFFACVLCQVSGREVTGVS